jgi:hypothetical protein
MSQSLEYVLHPPWWAAAFILVVGLGLLYSASKKMDRTLIRVSLVLILLGIVMGVVGQVFPSNREKMEKRTRAMVTAIDHQDWQGLGKLVDFQTNLSTASQPIVSGAGSIVKLAETCYERFGVKSASVLRMSSEQTQTIITVNVEVYSEQDLSGGRPIFTNLQLDYVQAGDVWALQNITILNVDGHSGDEIAGRIK